MHLEINSLWLSTHNKTYYFQIPDNGCIRTKGFECTCGQGLETPNPWRTVSRGCYVQCQKFQRQSSGVESSHRGQSQPRPKAAAPGQGNCIGRIKKGKANWQSRPLFSGIYRQNILGDIRVEGCSWSTTPFGAICAFHRQLVGKTSQSWRQSICFLGRAPKDFGLIVSTPALHQTKSFKYCWTPSRSKIWPIWPNSSLQVDSNSPPTLFLFKLTVFVGDARERITINAMWCSHLCSAIARFVPSLKKLHLPVMNDFMLIEISDHQNLEVIEADLATDVTGESLKKLKQNKIRRKLKVTQKFSRNKKLIRLTRALTSCRKLFWDREHNCRMKISRQC